MELNNNDDWCRCKICGRMYSSEIPISAEAGRGGQEELNFAIPVQSAVCSHILCLFCIKEQTPAVKTGDGDEEAQYQVVQCPICWRENAFDNKEPIISVITCNLLEKLEALQPIQLKEDENDAKKLNLQQERDVNAIKTPERNLTVKANLKAAHFNDTPDIYTGDEEPELPHQRNVAYGKKKHDNYIYDEQEQDLSQYQFKRVPRDDESSDDDSFGNNEVAENKDSKVAHCKLKPDLYFTRDGGPDSSHQLLYNKILDEDELPDEVKDVSQTVNAGNTHQSPQQPPVHLPPVSQPPMSRISLPGAFPVNGPHVGSTNENEDVFHTPTVSTEGLYLAVATPVNDPPILPIAHAEPLLPFHVKYRRLLYVAVILLFLAVVVSMSVLLPKHIQHDSRENSLKRIVLQVSNKNDDKDLGVSQISAMKWILGSNNKRFDPTKDQKKIEQRYQLAALYHSMDGDNWSNKKTFLTSDNECEWYSIKCDNDEVVEISLDANNLTGSIPPEIGRFLHLKQLNLGHNMIVNMLPSELGHASSLQVLNLTHNKISGSLPTTLGNLIQLIVVDISYNTVTGNVPSEMKMLTQLSWLDLSSNKFIDDNNQLANILPISLTVLNLSTNAMKGSTAFGNGLASYKSLIQLTMLDLSDNQFVFGGIPSELSMLTKLKVLSLNDCRLSGPIPSEVGNLKQLRQLSLQHNKITGTIPSELGYLTYLTTLDFSFNNLHGTIPSVLGNLTYMEVLKLNHNEYFSGKIPTELCNLKHLTWLELYFNLLTGPIPSELGNLENLRHLDLFGNQLTGTFPTELGNLVQLDFLDLSLCPLNGTIPSEFGKLSQLKSLLFHDTNIHGTIPRELSNASHLNLMFLYKTDVSGTVPSEFKWLVNLTTIQMWGTSVAGDLTFLCDCNSHMNLYIDTNMNISSCPCCAYV